jgi:hypothetical protein
MSMSPRHWKAAQKEAQEKQRDLQQQVARLERALAGAEKKAAAEQEKRFLQVGLLKRSLQEAKSSRVV